jgi:hypothetical protein
MSLQGILMDLPTDHKLLQTYGISVGQLGTYGHASSGASQILSHVEGLYDHATELE